MLAEQLRQTLEVSGLGQVRVGDRRFLLALGVLPQPVGRRSTKSLARPSGETPGRASTLYQQPGDGCAPRFALHDISEVTWVHAGIG